MSRKINREYTESLKDLLLSMGIQSKKDWLAYVEKNNEKENLESKSTENKLIESSGINFAKNSVKPIEFIYPCKDKEFRKYERMRFNIRKILEPTLQKAEVPKEKKGMCRSVGRFFSIILQQGPIEHISNVVFAIFTMIKTVVLEDDRLGINVNLSQEIGIRLHPPYIDEPLTVMLDRIALMGFKEPKKAPEIDSLLKMPSS
ncbi:uncharacterized protein LOC108051891 [Drosophila rhopaloa]|uniref:Uncharacterized protein n=1 Tax=Drosophila rhopaloa TaxID=1041015 RepID=A0ABM5I3X7_DRORH|nr:uncharacterized protein LOC108051891 [Drosophila rhopaloa]